MLRKIMAKMPDYVVDRAGLVLHGVRMIPEQDCLLLTVLPNPPIQDGTVILDAAETRQMAMALLAMACAMEDEAREQATMARRRRPTAYRATNIPLARSTDPANLTTAGLG